MNQELSDESTLEVGGWLADSSASLCDVHLSRRRAESQARGSPVQRIDSPLATLHARAEPVPQVGDGTASWARRRLVGGEGTPVEGLAYLVKVPV